MKNFYAVAILVLVVIAGIFVFAWQGKKEVVSNPLAGEQVASIKGCYVATLSKDVYTITIISQDGEKFKGALSFKNFEKDSSSGTYEGTYKDGILLGDYSFDSEGMRSVMQVIFKNTSEGFVRGFGDMNADGTRFSDLNNITYDTKYTFKPSGCAPEITTYQDSLYKISFSYPKVWGEVEIIPANKTCPEEDTYRTPETLSIYDRELRFADRDLPNTDSIIRSGIRLYRMDPTKSNNCNDELLRRLANQEITGQEISSFRLMPANISPFYGVHNEEASRLDTESREQYTLFLKKSGTSILIIQPYMSFIPFNDSPEWKEIDSNYKMDILAYVQKGKTAGQIREFLTQFRRVAGSIKSTE
jgi:hypothetical protein